MGDVYVDFHGQKTDFRGQKSDFRGQKSDFRGQKTDFRDQKWDFRGSKSASLPPKKEGFLVLCDLCRRRSITHF